MSHITVKKKKKEKYLTSDFSSGINKKLSPKLQGEKKSKFAICSFVCFTEPFDWFCFREPVHANSLYLVIPPKSLQSSRKNQT